VFFDDVVSRFNVSNSARTIGALVTVTGLVLEVTAPTKLAMASGKAAKFPLTVKIVAGSAKIILDYKLKGRGSDSINASIPLAGKSPTKPPACSLLLSAAGTITFSCAKFGIALPLQTAPASAVPTGGSLTAVFALAGTGLTASSDVASVDVVKPDDPIAVRDVGRYTASTQQCTAYSLVNDTIPDMDNTRIFLQCDGTGELEIESVPASLEDPQTFAPGCDTPANGSIEWTSFAYQGVDDPAFNGTLFKQVYYFQYSPPDSWSGGYSYTFTYTLKRKGVASSANVTCIIPVRPAGAASPQLAAAWGRSAARVEVAAAAAAARAAAAAAQASGQ
jgi:hypothetical protein